MIREWQKIENGRVTDSTTDPEVVKAWMMAGFDVRSVSIQTMTGEQKIQEVAE